MDLDRIGICFVLRNKSEKPISVDWDQSSLRRNGTSRRAIHKDVSCLDRFEVTDMQPVRKKKAGK